ncbi:sodium:solute symporter family protein [Leekyejoonella antrihumi]|uniref:Sodium:solute symporter family protein n=1 Tax=Leekyejoonella antrihumi TaxID=1660198 RepID=A0A563DYV8_9MICO|nr:sodium:solute symporter family protein [Leekyejoonella antrihumi]TWP35448.1 sodium:solute symporter family protein [Leekyejoonella antrihumi]
MNGAMIVLILAFVATLALGVFARRGKQMDLEGWSVGSRGFGSLIVFLLLAGEIYTTFTFLGASGWAYAHGGAAYYILCYGALAYVISYWLAPAIWRYGTSKKLLTQPDWFISKYNNRLIGAVVAVIGIVAMVPYLELQLKGLGIIVEETSYGKIPSTLAIWVGALALTAYVVISGIHAAATNAIVKDVLVLIVVVGIGLYLPLHHSGSIDAMFHSVQNGHPGMLALSPGSYNTGWFISSIVLSSLGFFMWPHYFGAVYSSKNPRTFRRNAMLLPLYQLVLLFVFFIGFTALLVVPGLADGDMSLLAVARAELPSWIVGVVGAAGMFCALVPGAMLLTTCGTVIAKNVVQEVSPGAPPARIAIAAKICVPVVALVALFLLFQGGSAIVNLLLLGYAFVTQLLPSMLMTLRRNNPITAAGATAGMVVGAAVVAWLTISTSSASDVLGVLPPALQHINVGVVALVINIVVMIVVSLVTTSQNDTDATAERATVASPAG